MNRTDLESWLSTHPDSIHAPTGTLLDRCESEVRSHAQELAWIHAREVAEHSLHRFERAFGLPASEIFVTREVCHEIARELKHHEPHVERTEESEWVSRSVLDALEPGARRMLREWLFDLAEREEHRAWQEIVSFTHKIATALIREGHMTRALDWDFERSYPRLAAQVTEMLIHEFEAHAREVARYELEGRPRH
jgi:hypothetical protein